jgi:hypothetical protein
MDHSGGKRPAPNQGRVRSRNKNLPEIITIFTSVRVLRRQKMLSIIAIVLVTLISPAHADEQNTALQTDTSPIETPPLPRPKPSSLDATGDDPAVLISAFRH